MPAVMNYYNYFSEIEEHFVRRRGKHLYISPMDWSLIATWRDSGVPLHIALRGIDRAMDGFLAKRTHSTSIVSSLFYCHATVMEEYAQYLESHLGESKTPQGAAAGAAEPAAGPDIPDKAAVIGFLGARIAEIKAVSAKLSLPEGEEQGTDRIVSRLEEIARDLETGSQADFESLDRDLAILDEALVRELHKGLPPGKIEEWEQQAKKELKIYRKKLPKETYAEIVKNFLRTKTRQFFAIAELSLFHL
jgi:hypothetical protein